MIACCIMSDPVAGGSPYGPPVAAFEPDTDITIPAYSSQTFVDTSTGHPTSWLWTVNGTPFSIGPSLTNFFTLPGVYNVTLEVTNAYGTDSVSHFPHVV